MPTIKEFREFFLRNTAVNAGAKRDQETGFPTQYLIDGVLKYNRFLKGDYPNEDVFKKLFESIPFKLNPEDTATTLIQGLLKLATDADAIASTETWTDNVSRAVTTYQLPVTIADAIPGNVVVTVTPTVDTLTGGRTRRGYKVKANYTPPAAKVRVIYAGGKHANLTVLNGGNLVEAIELINIPANSLVNNGDKLVIEGMLMTNGLFPTTPIVAVLNVEDGAANTYNDGFFDTSTSDWRWEYKITITKISGTRILVQFDKRNEFLYNNVPTIVSYWYDYAFNTGISQDISVNIYWGGGADIPIGAITSYATTATLYTT